jgi:hypothetical protein
METYAGLDQSLNPMFTLRDDLVSNGVTGQVVSRFTGDSNV